jgi:dihydroorotate dehydrogenase
VAKRLSGNPLSDCNSQHALYGLARPILFSMDPEQAHHLTLASLQRSHQLGLSRLLARSVPDQPVTVMGLRFPNPVGLAAGLDKNGAYIDALGDLGFGFVEVGTVTPKGQAGNPKPRLFRLPQARALINRLGFNNEGLDAFLANVRQRRYQGILGLNIGKNASTPIENATSDYLTGLCGVYPYADYVTVNISSPNTQNLRSLQQDDELRKLIGALTEARKALADDHGRFVPLAVKIAPDLEDDAVRQVADTLVSLGVDAIIATNTTLARDAVAHLNHGTEMGGLSGQPLKARSTQVVRLLAQHLQGQLPIIGVGGILSGADAQDKIDAGASLVQVYTGLIYRGPALVAECRESLLRHATDR